MKERLNDRDIEEALETCAAEPVHIPGTVQPFGCLIAADAATGRITHASENTGAIIGTACEDLLGTDMYSVFDRGLLHDVKNTAARGIETDEMGRVGNFDINGVHCTVHAQKTQGVFLIEFEHHRDAELSGVEALRSLNFLMRSIEACTSEQSLFDVTVRLIRMLSGYDRVMVYRFDNDWNGEIMAEECRRSMDKYIGLRFPHWDIPAQARAMMERLPIRIISDVNQVPVPLVSLDPAAPPLDISQAYARGVSSVHMEYLRNMGLSATMTLTLKVDGHLWGILSFHSLDPRVPSADLRDILVSLGQVFSAKLQLLQQKARLIQVEQVDALKDRVVSELSDDDEFQSFAKTVLEILDADGLVLTLGEREQRAGQVPDPPLLAELQGLAASTDRVESFENLTAAFPGLSNAANGCAGAIVLSSEPERTLCLFRKERTREVSWAGNPEKTIELYGGRQRLSPRGSFAVYLEQVRGYSDPWSQQDLYFASRIWTLVNSVERRELMNSMARQQTIMINELNHRVRNILALVRSVSEQARRGETGAVEAYSRSLEARIEALAASHDLAFGRMAASLPVDKLFEKELDPYGEPGKERYRIDGTAPALRADLAPILVLVIHELVTNAVKHGALSNADGQVLVTLDQGEGGLEITWQEVGGPPVSPPTHAGFGSTLTRHAIPHELRGETALEFDEAGLRVRMVLPRAVFAEALPGDTADGVMAAPTQSELDALADVLEASSCLVVEDSFMLAEGLRRQLADLNIGTIDTAAGVEEALDHLDRQSPTFAILDISLRGGETSVPVAHRLREKGVPFVFFTGYGDTEKPGEAFDDVLRLTKPALTDDILLAIGQILGVIGSKADG